MIGYLSLFFEKNCISIAKYLKKDVTFKWNDLEKGDFKSIEQYIIHALALLSLDFNKEVFLYTFASDHPYAIILTQKSDQGAEVPISFNSSNFQGDEINCSDLETQAYIVFKSQNNVDNSYSQGNSARK